jgi:Flp pilus assembly pilin Flp
MRKAYRRLRRDQQGATIVEFALVAPIMILLIMGLGELAFQRYMQAVLIGAMQKAGRDNTVQGNQSGTSSTSIDQIVLSKVQSVYAKAAFASPPTRKSYSQFGAVAAEPFDDNNKNGVFDPKTECFTDMNGNKTWDSDPGITGGGGASDVVVYSVSISYPRLFPLGKIMGWGSSQQITSTTVLKNQPYAAQNAYTPTRVCPT